VGTTAGYGFSFYAHSLTLPLVLQFFVAGNGTALLLINSTLISDLCEEGEFTTTINMVRFLMGGLFIGVVQLVIERLGPGITFAILAGLVLGLSPIMVVQWVRSGRRRGREETGEMRLVPGSGLVL